MHRSNGTRRYAVSTVEFALILPILLAILLGIVEFGWMVKCNLTLANATREGARTASLGATTADISNRVTTSASPLVVTSPTGSITMQFSGNGGTSYQAWPADTAATTSTSAKNGVAVGNLIRISTTSNYRSLTRFFPFLNNRTLNTFVTMRREL